MKKIYPIVFLLTLCFSFVKAQITINASSVVAIGNSVEQAFDTSYYDSSILMSSGANVDWDFTNLAEHFTSTLDFISPEETPYEDDFPNANVAIEQNGEFYFFLDKSQEKIEIIGVAGEILPDSFVVAGYSNGETILQFPATYQDQFDDVSRLVLQFAYSDPNVPIFDSIRIVRLSESSFNIDAYGTVTIPLGTYDAIRVQRETANFDSVYVHSPLLGWSYIPEGSEPDTVISYNWWTNTNGLGYPLVEATIQESGEVGDFSWLKSFITSTGDVAENNFSIRLYPNPASDYAIIELDQVIDGNIEVIDLNGRKMEKKVISGTQAQLNLSAYSAGTYVAVVSGKNGRIYGFQKFEVKR